MKILFIGDNPSLKNHSQDVAFNGSQSGKVLDSWIIRLKLNEFSIKKINSHIEELLKLDIQLYNPDKIVALGNLASQMLSKLHIMHFKMPHPSGRNRLLNDKNYVSNKLLELELYLNS